ncbi:MAG TPA: class I SAM-dependent methyltransferase [Verrucomicrobiae bacterium]|jgi:SAM-dependent methyltransferase|nr:class I SAM-dependent methyltransferase [Verrucomicrobiae bacterium]
MKAHSEHTMESVQVLHELQRDWTRIGDEHPYLGTAGNARFNRDEYFESGLLEIKSVLSKASACGLEVARGKALDFACGMGRVTQALSRTFEEVHGLDISPSMIARAKAENVNPEKCCFRVCCDQSLSGFEPDFFDLIVAINVLQYIPPLLAKGYVREFVRLLKPGALLYFQMTEGLFPRQLFPGVIINLYRRWKNRRSPLFGREHRFHVRSKKASATVAEGGGRVVYVEYVRKPTLWIEYGVFVTKG